MTEIETLADFKAWIKNPESPAAIQSLDLWAYEDEIAAGKFPGSLFLGCEISDELAGHIVGTGGIVIPNDKNLLFAGHRSKLYTPDEIFEGFDPKDEGGYFQTRDYAIYQQYLEQGKAFPPSIKVSLMRRLHDHSITDALLEFIDGKKVVAVMGGHGMERGEGFYLKVARVSRFLTREGFLMVSGGGPGAMEATHLGAYFAAREERELIAAIDEMKKRPEGAVPKEEFKDPDWLHRAWQVKSRYPIPPGKSATCASVGIPTWLYGHEPPAPFATHIAKYFANSVREDGLLAIAKYGVIFAPGSAGTTQEIFQDAAQNHYGTMGYISPMILFGKKRWTEERPLWDLIRKAAQGQRYSELLTLTDDETEIIAQIRNYKPQKYRV